MTIHYRHNSVAAAPSHIPEAKRHAEAVRPKLPRRRRRLNLAILIGCVALVILWRLWGRAWIARTNTIVRWPEEEDATTSQCDKVTFHTLANLKTSQRMNLQTFVNGYPVTNTTTLFAPQKICILAAIPQTPPDDLVFRDLPVPGKGPDTIHLLLYSSAVTLTFPPLRPLPGQAGIEEQFASHPILYYAEATLAHNGIYILAAEREWANWRWAKQYQEDLDDQIFLHDSGLKEPLFSARNLTAEEFAKIQYYPNPVPIQRMDIHPSIINVIGPTKMLSRPVCEPKNLAVHGRWYKASEFPDHPVPPGLVDNWGHVWEGDHCRLEYYSDKDEFDCFAGKVIHLYGASNGRRMSRTILSGSRWCEDFNDICQSDDKFQPVEQAIYDSDGLLRKHESLPDLNTKFWLNEYTPYDFGNKSKLYFMPLRSASLMPYDWLRMLYDPADFHLSAKTIHDADHFGETRPRPFSGDDHIIRTGAQARPPPELEKADLVVVIMGGWDQAIDYDFDDYERVLPYFRDALLEAYHDVPIVIRLSTGYCCRQNFWDSPFRRLTGTRVQHMLDQFRKAFKVEGTLAMDGRVNVFDPSFMYGRYDPVVKDQHPANHPPATHIRTEMQMFLNAVCRKDTDSRIAQLRGFTVNTT